MKDHEIREFVNQLRDIAIKYHGTQQLRERIAHVVRSNMLSMGESVFKIDHNSDLIKHVKAVSGMVRAGNSPAHSDCCPAKNSVAPALNPIDHGYRPDCECSGCKATARICAELAGNSPVIPDGYVMVPREPTEEMNKAGWAAMNEHDAINPTYRAMIAAATHDTPALNSVQSVATVPGKWIPVSERMPETDGNYWGWWSESKRQGPVWFIKSELQAQFQSSEITHWMPLPAAPQEVK